MISDSATQRLSDSATQRLSDSATQRLSDFNSFLSHLSQKLFRSKTTVPRARSSVFPIVLAAAIFVPKPQDAVATEAVSSGNQFSGVYGGFGLGGKFLENSFDTSGDNHSYYHVPKSLNLFGGTLFLGGGEVFRDKFYVGGEVLVDIAKSKTYGWNIRGWVSPPDVCEERGIVPAVALRLGYVQGGWLFYIKPVALAFPKFTVDFEVYKFDDSKSIYSLGLGVEKAFAKEFSARLEVEYSSGSKKGLTGDDDWWMEFKNHRGFSLRILVAYPIKS